MTVATVTSEVRQAVVDRLHRQIGSPYQWGSAGPTTFDCSGSALSAWKGFVDLPHNTTQMVLSPNVHVRRAGVKVGGTWPRYLLLPGDLIFYYGDVRHPDSVSHVATFLGAGKIANATGIVDGVNRGVELITIDQYAAPSGFGFIGHQPA